MTLPTDAPRAVLVPAMLAMIVAGTLVSAAMTPKDMSQGEASVEVSSATDLAAFDISRLVTAGVLGLSALTVTLAIAAKGLPRSGLGLWLAYLTFTFTNFVLPGLVGQARGLDLRMLYAAVVFSAVYVSAPLGNRALVVVCKAAFGAFLYAALVGAALVPSQVVAADYEGLLPLLDFRLYGFGGGATSLGAQAAGYLALEVAVPSRTWTRYLHGGVAALVLVLTQSKTSWAFVIAGAVLLMLWTLRTGSTARHEVEEASGRQVSFGAVAVAVLVASGAVAAALVIALSGGSPGADNLRTLTGRGYIWATSFEVWLANPLFGYGVGLWLDEGFRAVHGGFAHAHNQFLHALASGGIVGFAGLLVYFATSWRIAWRAAPANPGALVLLSLLMVQCLTDVPMRHLQVLDAWTLVHLLTFVAVRQAAGGEPAESLGLAQRTFT